MHVFFFNSCRTPSTSAMMAILQKGFAVGTGPMKSNSLRGVRWVSNTLWPKAASALHATPEPRTAAVFLQTCRVVKVSRCLPHVISLP